MDNDDIMFVCPLCAYNDNRWSNSPAELEMVQEGTCPVRS